MLNKPTFHAIENYSKKIEENEFFIQFTNQIIPDHYDSNYVLLKFSPTLQEFKLIEKMHQEYQEAIQQTHLNFKWPDDMGLHPELLAYFDQDDYKIGMQNLYWITPELMQSKKINKTLVIQKVTKNHLKDFFKINLEEDLLHGTDFSEHKKRMYAYQYQQKNTTFILAYLNDTAVGSLILIDSKDYLEVDNVLTKTEFRGNNIATTMLNDVINKHTKKDQVIILVADAEDTPKEMYKKMGFKYAAKQITAQKDL